MEVTMLILGVLVLSIALGLLFRIGKRRFNRRNVAGLEGFPAMKDLWPSHFWNA